MLETAATETQDWISLFGSQWDYDVAFELLEVAADREFIDTIARLRLTRNEALAIRAYTLGVRGKASPYEHINSFLRFGSPTSKCIDNLCLDLISGVTKMPLFDGPVFRKTTLPDEIWRALATGSTFSDKGLLSTSTRPKVFSGRDIMVIFSQSGRRIATLSAIPSEDEVVFLPDTRFAVSRIERQGPSLIVEMEEVR